MASLSITGRSFVTKGVAYSLLFVLILVPISLAITISQRATFASTPPLVAGIVTLFAGLWAFQRPPHSPKLTIFALLCGALAVESIGAFMTVSSRQTAEASFWASLSLAGITAVPALLYHLCVLAGPENSGTRTVWTPYTVGVAVLVLLPTGGLIDGATRFFWGYHPQAGPLHPLLVVYFLVTITLGLRRLYMASRPSADTSEARRLGYLFCALLFVGLSGIDFLATYGVAVYPCGYLLAMIAAVAGSYVLSHPTLRNLTPTLGKPNVLAYAEAFSLLILFSLAILSIVRYFTGIVSYQLAGLLLGTSTLFAGLLAGIQQHMETVVGHALFKEKENAYDTLTAFSRAMVSILDLPTLTQTILSTLSRVLRLKTVSLFLLDHEKNAFLLSAFLGPGLEELHALKLSAADELPHYLRCSHALLVKAELRHHAHDTAGRALVPILAAMHAEVCLPLINKDRLIGFINLGERLDAPDYASHELHLLTSLAQHAAVALDNAMLYTDLKRSQVLMRRTDRLRSLETIAGGFAHEIRNPLTSIKTFIQLAPTRREDAEFILHFSEVVIEDVYRIERLIHEILDYARYREPKFVPEDINEVVASCLYFIEVKAGSKLITIEKHLEPDLPPVLLDRQQIKQVLLNLFLNAMDAMDDAGGRLTVKTHRMNKPDGSWVQIEVADTGAGIAPSNLEHIFDPFYTTKHESGEHEGTGLGLTIVHEIVQEHHGSVDVTSTVGRGTTFFVNLRTDPLGFAAPQHGEHNTHEKTSLAH